MAFQHVLLAAVETRVYGNGNSNGIFRSQAGVLSPAALYGERGSWRKHI